MQFTAVVPTGNADPEGGTQLAAPTPGQLSETPGGGKVTVVPTDPGGTVTVMFEEQVSTGGSTSLTVTDPAPVVVLPAGSCAVQVTAVDPTGKLDPEGGTQLNELTAQLSVAVAEYGTAAEHKPGAFGTVTFGTDTVGGSVSLTVTLKPQLPPPNSELQLTAVVPTGKFEPEAGVQLTVPQIPPAIAGAPKLTVAPHWPSVFGTVALAGQLKAHEQAEVVISSVQLASCPPLPEESSLIVKVQVPTGLSPENAPRDSSTTRGVATTKLAYA